jgi:hypothetical protein
MPRSKNEWSYTFTLPIHLHGIVLSWSTGTTLPFPLHFDSLYPYKIVIQAFFYVPWCEWVAHKTCYKTFLTGMFNWSAHASVWTPVSLLDLFPYCTCPLTVLEWAFVLVGAPSSWSVHFIWGIYAVYKYIVICFLYLFRFEGMGILSTVIQTIHWTRWNVLKLLEAWIL